MMSIMACGSDSPNSGAAGDGGASATDIVGNVLVTIAKNGANFRTTSSASFLSGTPSAIPAQCESSTLGGCTALSCPGVGDAGTVKFKSLNAGTITIADGTPGITPLTLSYDAQSEQYPLVAGEQIIQAGDELKVTGEGVPNGIPSFDISAKASGEISGSNPTLSDTKSIELSRTKDFAITFTGSGASGTVSLSITTSDLSNGAHASVTCAANPANGKITVTKDALAKLLKADGRMVLGTIALSPEVQVTQSTGGLLMTFTVRNTGVSGLFTNPD